MKKILIPVDASEYSKKAVEEGMKMAKAFGSDVVLLYVLSVRVAAYRYNTTVPQPAILEPILEYERTQAEEMLKNYKESFGEMKDKVETLILQGTVADEILKYIKKENVDFVVMGSHGIGSVIYRNLVGSTTNTVIHHSEKPVLVVR